jgi:hypothetical protein
MVDWFGLIACLGLVLQRTNVDGIRKVAKPIIDFLDFEHEILVEAFCRTTVNVEEDIVAFIPVAIGAHPVRPSTFECDLVGMHGTRLDGTIIITIPHASVQPVDAVAKNAMGRTVNLCAVTASP